MKEEEEPPDARVVRSCSGEEAKFDPAREEV
jgi:hypothetical protein